MAKIDKSYFQKTARKGESRDNDIIERCHIYKALLLLDLPIKEIELTESPDITFYLKDRKIGVDHTRIVNHDPNQKIFFRYKSLLKSAEMKFKENYPEISIHAKFKFSKSDSIQRQPNSKLVEELIEAVYKKHSGKVFKLPSYVDRLTTTKHSNINFTIDAVIDSIEPLTIERLNKAKLDKENKYSIYKENHNLEECWLLIVIGSLSATYFELDSEINYYKIRSNYDRIYIMEDFNNKIIRIK